MIKKLLKNGLNKSEIQRLGYQGSLRWLQQVMQKYELRRRIKEEETLVRFTTEMAEQMQV